MGIMPTRLRRIATQLVEARAEILTAFVIVAGWLLITSGLAAMTEALPQRIAAHLSRAVWLLSIGVLAISLGGWRMLRDLARDGLYALTKGD